MKENIAYFRSHKAEEDLDADSKLHDIHQTPDIKILHTGDKESLDRCG